MGRIVAFWNLRRIVALRNASGGGLGGDVPTRGASRGGAFPLTGQDASLGGGERESQLVRTQSVSGRRGL